MQLTRFTYHVRFVNGILADLETDMHITWPNSSAEREHARVKFDIEHGRVIEGLGSSNYRILSYTAEPVAQ